MGEQVLTTGGLREDGRGRHTTTRRQLMLLPNGALIIDTPGMRELGMTDGAGEGVGHIFDDIDTLIKECRFSDCTHTIEPGCAILAALAEGSLTAERWGAYQKLQKEVRYAEEQSVYLKEKRARFKEISKTKRNRPSKKR